MDNGPLPRTVMAAALVREATTGKTVAASIQVHIRTAYEARIPSSVMRLRMLQATELQ